tara:strand:- start:1559 stop:2644 length:1086 start_codon:yes stop_codon:yes gene_type:complete
MINKIYTEKFNASDDSFEVTEIHFKIGDMVKKDEIIFSIETSKADIDIESKFSGYIYYKIKINESISVGDLFYIISENKIDDISSIFNDPIYDKRHDNIIISAKAQKIISENKIDPVLINKEFIKEKDVIDFLNKKNAKKEKLADNLVSKIKSIDTAKNVIILGGKGGAKMVIDAIDSNDQYKVFGILDDNLSTDNKVFDVHVIGKFSLIDELINNGFTNFVIAFGVIENRKKRFELFNEIKAKGGKFVNIIHKRSIVENSVIMGEGNVVLAGANIGSAVEMGDLNYINNSCIVSHDCKIKDNVHVSPGAVLASSIEVESNCLIGMNSTLFYGLTIGENSVINNGVIINNDIPKNSFIKST